MIDVVLTRDALRAADLVVVIDVLRATSTITQALHAGYATVLCVDSVEHAGRMHAPGRVLAGERHCVMPAGFDQGNSPLDAMNCHGRELVLATTNGAPAIVSAARCAPRVLLACLLNAGAVLQRLCAEPEVSALDLLILCAGTDGAPALEDTYLAGLLCAGLPGPRTDTALIAEAVSESYPSPFEALSASADAQVLKVAGLADDIAFCAQESNLQVLPQVLEAGGGVAAVAAMDPQVSFELASEPRHARRR